MEIISREEDETMKRLYKASREGSVVSLNSIIQNNPLILNKISLTTFTETPLHISALLGHLHFTRQLLALEPKLASKLDSFKRSPLHLASAKGHAEIVQALLEKNVDMCFAKDQEGRIPLHYAAMRGHVDAIEKLLSIRPSTMIFQVIPDSGETVLHLCVQYNHLEALKALVESVGYDNIEFLNMKEHSSGNTILHLAVMLKQIETIKYLVSIPGVQEGAKVTLNYRGFTALDLTELFPREFKTAKIQRLLMNIGHGSSTCSASRSQMKLHQLKSSSGAIPMDEFDVDVDDDDDDDHDHDHEGHSSKTNTSKSSLKGKTIREKCWSKWLRYLTYKGELSQQTHNSMMVVATVIATMTFQGANNPPGGVWQDSYKTTKKDFECSEKTVCYAGTAVLAYSGKWRDDFEKFVAYNSASFLSSLAVILLLISGIPLKNKLGTWALTMAMCMAVTFMAGSFLQSLLLITPDNLINPVDSIYNTSAYAWLGLLGLIVFFHTVRLISWLLFVKKLWPKFTIPFLSGEQGN